MAIVEDKLVDSMGSPSLDVSPPALGSCVVVGLMAPTVEALSAMSFRDMVGGVGVARSMLAAVEAQHVAARSDAGFSSNSTRRNIQTIGNLSSDEAARATQRGEAVQANPVLGSDLAAGVLSVDHANVIADTASKTGGAAATDNRFLNRVRGTNPDQAAKIGAGYVEDHKEQLSEADVGSEYQRQYRARTARRIQTRRGTKILQLEGPASTIDQLWSALMGDADRLYRTDGGRDVPHHTHPRTREQRLFDAALQRLTNTTAPNQFSRSRSTIVATLDLNTLGSACPTTAAGTTQTPTRIRRVAPATGATSAAMTPR